MERGTLQTESECISEGEFSKQLRKLPESPKSGCLTVLRHGTRLTNVVREACITRSQHTGS